MPKSSISSSNATASVDGLSALIDGEADPAAAARWCEQWRGDEQTRRDWHAYQLIGDVMRSEDLASTAQADSAFLTQLRSRLALEPVIVAPQELSSSTAVDDAAAVTAPLTAGHDTGRTAGRYQPRRWATPVAVAAGFMAVAGVLLVNGLTLGPTAPAQTLASTLPSSQSVALSSGGNGVQTVSSIVPSQAQQQGQAPSALQAAGTDARGEPRTVVANGQLIRNARLDRYLAAHKQFGGSSAPGTPLGYLRSASAEAGQ